MWMQTSNGMNDQTLGHLHQRWFNSLLLSDAIFRHRSGVGLTKPISSVPLFSSFSSSSKHTLAIEYHVYIWQVSPQLSCGDTWQIWMWFKESNMHFCKIEYFAYGEINERSFINPHPWVAILAPSRYLNLCCPKNQWDNESQLSE